MGTVIKTATIRGHIPLSAALRNSPAYRTEGGVTLAAAGAFLEV